jgi:hypothetical protein
MIVFPVMRAVVFEASVLVNHTDGIILDHDFFAECLFPLFNEATKTLAHPIHL